MVIRHQWHMAVNGQARAELLIQKHLPWRARDQVLAAQDMRDPHGNVVADDRQMVRERAIAAPHHEITDAGLHILANSRMKLIVEAILASRDPNPNCGWSVWLEPTI